MLDLKTLPQTLEAILLAAGRPLSMVEIQKVFEIEDEPPAKSDLLAALKTLEQACEHRGIELKRVGSGYQLQVKACYSVWVAMLWTEKPPRYSKALLETLSLIAYRQPITRGEIESIRGVSTSRSIFRTLQEERGWIRVVGHKEVPGRPALYATTKAFLDYFGLESLKRLPALPEIAALEESPETEPGTIEQLPLPLEETDV